jgi:very-short-patch-repair endonuclease
MLRLGRHIINTHHITLQEYYDRYLKIDGENICYCGKKKDFGRDLSEGYQRFCSPKCATSHSDTQKKMRKTCKENHGFENPLMEENNNKIQGMINKYGVEKPMQLKKFQDKYKHTLVSKYGVNHPSKIDFVKQKKIDTQVLHFGDLFCRTKEARRMYRLNFIRNIEKQGDVYRVQTGKNEKMILDEIELVIGKKIQRDFTCIGYFPDGYIPDLNLIIEVYEDHHNHTCYINHDFVRKKELIEKLNCGFFVISEKQWFENKQVVLQELKKEIHRT